MRKKDRQALRKFLDLIEIHTGLNRRVNLDNFITKFKEWEQLKAWLKCAGIGKIDKRIHRFLNYKMEVK